MLVWMLLEMGSNFFKQTPQTTEVPALLQALLRLWTYRESDPSLVNANDV